MSLNNCMLKFNGSDINMRVGLMTERTGNSTAYEFVDMFPHTGLKVSSLYIVQVKEKGEIIE